jgi:hypothetical protein
MKRNNIVPKTTIFVLLILLIPTLSIFEKLVVSEAADSPKYLNFFRITEDKKVYDQNRQQYNKELIKGPNGELEIYVERNPSLKLDFKEIESIVIQKHRIPGYDPREIEEALEEASGRKPKSQKTDAPLGYVYSANILLTEKGANLFIDFANSHTNETIEWRFENNRLGQTKIIGPFTRRAFNIGLEETNNNRIIQIFAPVKHKITWKDQ